MLGSTYKKRFWVQYMVRDCFYNGGVVLQYLLTISVFFRRSKTLLTYFLGAFEYLFFVTNCNDIHMHHEKRKSHTLALIYFQGCKCRGRVACKYPSYNFISKAGVRRLRSLTFGDLACCFFWPGKLRWCTPISPVKRDRRGPRSFLNMAGSFR